MPEARARIAARPGRTSHELRIGINEPDADFVVQIEQVENRLLAGLDDLLLDLLDVAAVVFFTDATETRGGPARDNFGEAWRRQMDFSIPVRRPDVWTRPEVGGALIELATFLTGDEVRFTFLSGEPSELSTRYLDLTDPEGHEHRLDDVVLFSGGLDSLAGAVELLETTSGRVALVSHESAPKITSRQRELTETLTDRFGPRVVRVPINATRRGDEAREITQRSRSFLYCAMGYMVARTLKAKRLHFFENGIVSLNLPVSPQVIGTMATRTTHPFALELMRQLLRVLGNDDIELDNRYCWSTKAAVVRKLDHYRAADLIDTAVSCTNVYPRNSVQTHCGSCSQCLDRRFALLATGLARHESPHRYSIDVLTGPREKDRDRVLPSEWTSHARRLANMTIAQFGQQFGGELVRALRGFPDLPRHEVLRKLFELHREHGQSVEKVLAEELSRHSGAIVEGRLPASSLLAAMTNRMTADQPVVAVIDPAPGKPWTFEHVEDEDDEHLDDILPLRAWFEVIGGRHVVAIRNLDTLSGPKAEVPHALLQHHREDVRAGLAPEEHRYVRGREVPLDRNVSESVVKQNISRAREQLRVAYNEITGRRLERPLLILSHPSRGYRLDPEMRELSKRPSG